MSADSREKEPKSVPNNGSSGIDTETDSQLHGQWFGSYQGTNAGQAILNIDRRTNGYSGSAVVIEGDEALPSAVYFATLSPPDANGRVVGHMDLNSHFDQREHRFLTDDEVRKKYPALERPAGRIEVAGTFRGRELQFDFQSDAETSGTAVFVRFPVPDSSTVQRRVVTWEQFKSEVRHADNRNKLFRGQPKPYPLRTSFHRAQRFDIVRFAVEDVSRLASAITSVTDLTFNMHDPRIHGAVLGIAQHHGFPTPLLDWSKSPYVAAYFACRDAATSPNRRDFSPTVFVIDPKAWAKHHRPVTDVNAPMPSLAFIEPLPLKNPRLLPQQSVLCYCNVDNFEQFVQQREQATSTSYLTAYSLWSDPAEILRDLRTMGVYAASLFPGLDGMCRGVFEDSIEV